MAKKSKKMATATVNPEMNNIVKIALIVVIVLVVVYLLTALLTGKIKLGDNKTSEEEVTIQYEEILAGESISQKDDEYLVLFYDSTTTEGALYETLLSQYKIKENALSYYRVDMGNGLNNMYKTDDQSNLFVTSASQLKIKDSALLKIVNHTVTEAYEGQDAITQYFK